MTTNVESVYPFQVLVTARSSELEHDSKTQAEPVRTISFARVGEEARHDSGTSDAGTR